MNGRTGIDLAELSRRVVIQSSSATARSMLGSTRRRMRTFRRFQIKYWSKPHALSGGAQGLQKSAHG
jgi:hypothetical protein